MTDETGSPAGGESAPVTAIVAPADTGADLSISQAARALTEARKPKNEAAESAEGATAENELSVEDNAAPDENQAHGEDQEADPAAEPPIERPKSWTEADEADWQATPRAQQKKIVARELERDTALRRAQNDAAEKLKGLTAKEQQAEQARLQYEAQLPALMQTLQDAQQSSFADVRTVDDVTKLANEDPFRYLQWQAHQTKLQAVNAELERARGEQSRAQQTDWTNHVQKENDLAAEFIPDLADKDKSNAFYKRAIDRLGELGFKSDEVNDLATGKSKLSIHDHRLQQLLWSDFKLADIQKAKTAVAAKPLPPVQRPGTAKPQGSATSERIQALTRQFNETGSLKAAQELRVAQRAAAQRRAS